jgi:hypothetical protein
MKTSAEPPCPTGAPGALDAGSIIALMTPARTGVGAGITCQVGGFLYG